LHCSTTLGRRFKEGNNWKVNRLASIDVEMVSTTSLGRRL